MRKKVAPAGQIYALGCRRTCFRAVPAVRAAVVIAVLIAFPSLYACGNQKSVAPDTAAQSSTNPPTTVATSIAQASTPAARTPTSVATATSTATPTAPTPTNVSTATAQAPTSVATPTDSSSSALPQTVTSNGISITLKVLDVTDYATRFDLMLALPDDIVSNLASSVIDQTHLEDVQVQGLSDCTCAPVINQDKHQAGDPTLNFWVTYNHVTPSDKTVTLTLARIWLTSPTPDSGISKVDQHPVSGPWIFTVTKADIEAEPLPRANNGNRLTGLSVTMAQRLVNFPIIQPKLPASIQPWYFNASAYSVGIPSSVGADYVMLYYTTKTQTPQDVLVVETTEGPMVPTPHDGKVSYIATSGGMATSDLKSGSEQSLTIDGVTVTTFEVDQDDSRQIFYTWKHDKEFFFVVYLVDADNTSPLLPSADLEKLIASIIDQSGNEATPQG